MQNMKHTEHSNWFQLPPPPSSSSPMGEHISAQVFPDQDELNSNYLPEIFNHQDRGLSTNCSTFTGGRSSGNTQGAVTNNNIIGQNKTSVSDRGRSIGQHKGGVVESSDFIGEEGCVSPGSPAGRMSSTMMAAAPSITVTGGAGTTSANQKQGSSSPANQKKAVKVLYNYEYTTLEGQFIRIEKGQVFDLLEKTNLEWWKLNDKVNQQFFAPANYIKVMPGESGSAFNINFLSLVDIDNSSTKVRVIKSTTSSTKIISSDSSSQDNGNRLGITATFGSPGSRVKGVGSLSRDSQERPSFLGSNRQRGGGNHYGNDSLTVGGSSYGGHLGNPLQNRRRNERSTFASRPISSFITSDHYGSADNGNGIGFSAASLAAMRNRRGSDGDESTLVGVAPVPSIIEGRQTEDEEDRPQDTISLKSGHHGMTTQVLLAERMSGDSVRSHDSVQSEDSSRGSEANGRGLGLNTTSSPGSGRKFSDCHGSTAEEKEKKDKAFVSGASVTSVSSEDSVVPALNSPDGDSLHVLGQPLSSKTSSPGPPTSVRPSRPAPPRPKKSPKKETPEEVEEEEEVFPPVTATEDKMEDRTGSSWESVTDTSGQTYYYNSVTKETSWNRPEDKDGSASSLEKEEENEDASKQTAFVDEDEETPACPSTTAIGDRKGFKSRRSLSRLKSGWTEVVTDGDKYFVHNATGQKWYAAVDESGKSYYYKEDTQESVWELPEVLSPAASTTRHLSIPDESTEDTNDGLRQVRQTGNRWGQGRRVKGQRASTLPSEIDFNAVFDEMEKADAAAAAASGSSKKVILASNSADRDKKGYLNVKTSEGSKKKFKKNWLAAYAVAAGPKLLVYRTDKHVDEKSHDELGTPEITVDLTACEISWGTKEVSSKKNTLLVRCPGSYYLLQHDDSLMLHQWHTIISGKIRRFKGDRPSTSLTIPPADYPLDSPTDPSPKGGSKTSLSRLDSNNKTNSKLSGSSKRHFKGSASKEGYDLNPLVVSVGGLPPEYPNKMGIKEKLKSFLTKRPSPQELENKGILKEYESIFSSHLQFLCDRESTKVPKFVQHCIKVIESKGLDSEGLYRLSGNLAQITKLRYEVDQCPSGKYNLTQWDIHVLTGALKLFFRELKEPLVPFSHYQPFLDAVALKDMTQLKLLIQTLPATNRETLTFLMTHLNKVCQESDKNRMQPQNVAIVFGPTLMKPLLEQSPMATSLMTQNVVVEAFLKNFKKLF